MRGIKSFLRRNRITNPIYQRLYGIKWNRIVNRRRRNLHKNSGTTLRFISRILNEHNIKYYAAFGTALGLIREGRLLAHDLDIDFVIMGGMTEFNRFENVMKELGIQLLHFFVFHEQKTLLTYKIHNTSIDFYCFGSWPEGDGSFAFIREKDTSYANDTLFTPYFIQYTEVKETRHVELAGTPIPVPHDVETYLCEHYGKNWRTPIKEWNATDSPAWHRLDDELAQITKIDSIWDHQ